MGSQDDRETLAKFPFVAALLNTELDGLPSPNADIFPNSPCPPSTTDEVHRNPQSPSVQDVFSAGLGSASEWIAAMTEEISRIKDGFHAIHPVHSVPKGATTVPTKWVLKQKPSRKKARLVATQSLARYYVPDTFSPTISLPTLRFMLAYAVRHDCFISTL